MCGLVPLVFTELFPQAQWEGDSLFPQMLFLFTSKSKMFLPEETSGSFLPAIILPKIFSKQGRHKMGPGKSRHGQSLNSL